jgi:beta-lactamase regulating signal transducer with metallopeptidase domain
MSFDANVLDHPGLAAGLALAIKATLVLAIGAAAAWMLRRRSAAGRHFVWLLTMNAVLGVTAFATLPRGLVVEVPRWPRWASERVVAPAPDEKQSVVVDLPAARDLNDVPAAPGVTEAPVRRHAKVASRAAGVHESGLEATGHATPAFETPSRLTPPLATPSRPAPPRATLPAAVASPAALLIAVWLVGTSLLLGRLALAHLGLAWVARRSHVVEDPSWLTLLRCLAPEAGVARPPRLCWSTAVGTPIACGLFRPSILLPLEAQSWEPERRRVVLLHELAHIARRDPLTQSIAWLACAIYWFQPAAWLAFTRLRAEGERACDDRVLSTGVAGPDYASHLLSLARRARTLRLAGAVSVAMARGSTLEGRLLALLDDGVRRGSLGLRARGAGIVTLGLVLFTVGLVRPVPPAAAVARATSSESSAPLAPPTPPIQAPAAARRAAQSRASGAPAAFSYQAIPAEPVAGLASDASTSLAVDSPTALAFDPSATLVAGKAEAGVTLAQSLVTTYAVARDDAAPAAAPFYADPPARPSDTKDSKSAAAPARPPSSLFSSFIPVRFSSAPATAPAPVAGARVWKSAAGGLWSEPKNWTPADVPDAPGESAVLPSLGGAYQVTLDINPTIDAISIDASDATLDMSTFSIAKAGHVTNSGTITNFAGVYNSDQIRNLTGGTVRVAPGGTIEIGVNALWNAGTIVAAKAIHWGGAVMLYGGGTLALNDTRLFDPNDPDPELQDQANKRITIAAGTTLRGMGTIEKHYINNSGLIQADVAQLSSAGNRAPEEVLWLNGIIDNHGTIRVMNGGHINVNRPLVINRDGLITSGPGGGSIRLEMPFQVFGSISALPPGCNLPQPTGGIIRADGGDLHVSIWNLWDARIQRGPGGGDVIFDQSTVMQDPIVDAGAEVVVDWFGPGSVMVNNGTVRLRKSMNITGMSTEDRTYINGTGELILEGATIGSGMGATLVNGAGHTISGCGTINPPFINEGTVSLDCSGGHTARIGGQAVPAVRSPDGTVAMPSGAIENRGRISIARGELSICGPNPARYPIEVAVPTVIKNKGTISAAGGHITLEKSVTLGQHRRRRADGGWWRRVAGRDDRRHGHRRPVGRGGREPAQGGEPARCTGVRQHLPRREGRDAARRHAGSDGHDADRRGRRHYRVGRALDQRGYESDRRNFHRVTRHRVLPDHRRDGARGRRVSRRHHARSGARRCRRGPVGRIDRVDPRDAALLRAQRGARHEPRARAAAGGGADGPALRRRGPRSGAPGRRHAQRRHPYIRGRRRRAERNLFRADDRDERRST